MSHRINIGHYQATAEEKDAVMTVLESGRLSPDEQVRSFEEEFSLRHSCTHGVMVNSGTDALRIALAALKERGQWQDNDVVFVPAITFVATANIVLQNKLTPYFIDIGIAGDYGINADRLAHFLNCSPSLRRRARAIMAVHLFGQPCDIGKVMDVARKYNLRVIEDSCETMGITYGDSPARSVGSFGDIACFSSYSCHLIQTGVGGIATTSDPVLADLMRSYANHGRDTAYIPGYSKPDLSRELLKKRFRFVREGYSSRVTEMQAALARVQLRHLPETILRRNQVAGRLLDALEPYQDQLHLPYPCQFPVREHAYMMFPICVEGLNRADLCFHLEQNGIETRELLPLINQPCYTRLVKAQLKWNLEKDFPVATVVNRTGFYVASHPGLTESDISFMTQTIGAFIEKGRKVSTTKRRIEVLHEPITAAQAA